MLDVLNNEQADFSDVDPTCMWWRGPYMHVVTGCFQIMDGSSKVFSINKGKRLVCSVSLKILSIFPQSQCWELNEMRLSWCDSVALPWRGRRLGADHLTQPETGTIWGRVSVLLRSEVCCVSDFCLLWGSLLCLWRAYLQSTLFGNALILKSSLVSIPRLHFGFQVPLYFLRHLHCVHSSQFCPCFPGT